MKENYKHYKEVLQVNTNEIFFWNGHCWQSKRNHNVKIRDEDMEYLPINN